MRNEYEAKIYELTEDLNMLNKKLTQKDQNHNAFNQNQNEQLDLIQELTEKNQLLTNELKNVNKFKYLKSFHLE